MGCLHPSNPRSGAVELQENLSNRLTFLLGREGRARGILDGEDGAPRARRRSSRGAVRSDASLSPYPTLSRRLPVPYTNSFDARLRPNRSVYRARPLRRACAPESRTHAASDVRRIPFAIAAAARRRSGAADRPRRRLLVRGEHLDGPRRRRAGQRIPLHRPAIDAEKRLEGRRGARAVPARSRMGLTESTQKTTSEPPVADLRAWPWRTWR